MSLCLSAVASLDALRPVCYGACLRPPSCRRQAIIFNNHRSSHPASMHVKALKLVNFKRFRNEYLEFNDDVNILVGDNNAGKSSILEALEIVLNYNYRGRQFGAEFSPDLFNKAAVAEFLASDKKAEKLPTL